jgi:glycerol-3-phosphate dehydrogenase (NAD(P)+)
MKVGVIGAGAWGTALAITATRSGNETILWSYDGQYKEFDDVVLPEHLSVTSKMDGIKDTDIWLIVTPSAFFRETLKKARNFYNGQPVIICTKGAECSTGEFMSEILHDVLPECIDFGVLSGPQFAAEVAMGYPTGSTLAGTNNAIVAAEQALNKLYLEPISDVIGTEICGVGKNAAALISGYNSVMASGENERALLFTRVWDDVVKIGVASGAQVATFLKLCGLGDLYLSATSVTSRNYSGGIAIANGQKPEGTVEGIHALCGLIERAKTLGVDVPVLTEMKQKLKI